MTFGDPSSYTFLGTSRDVHVCDACGKKDLRRTFVVSEDEGGETMYLGADCAGKALGLSGTPRALALKLRSLEKRRGTKAAPKIKNREDVPRVIEGEIDGAVSRAIASGARSPVEYVGAGMTGIVLTDGKKVYKVARHSRSTLAEEAEWLLDAAKVPFVKGHVAGHVVWNAEHGVIVRDYVKGRPGRWGEEGKLRDLHDEIERHMLPAGWSAPEFKGDSYIMTDAGPILVDASMPSRVGKNLVGYVEDVLDGKREASETLSDLAFMLRREVIAKFNPKGTIEARDMRRLLNRLEERGVDFDRSYKDV